MNKYADIKKSKREEIENHVANFLNHGKRIKIIAIGKSASEKETLTNRQKTRNEKSR